MACKSRHNQHQHQHHHHHHRYHLAVPRLFRLVGAVSDGFDDGSITVRDIWRRRRCNIQGICALGDFPAL
jgi:hypothetical protein